MKQFHGICNIYVWCNNTSVFSKIVKQPLLQSFLVIAHVIFWYHDGDSWFTHAWVLYLVDVC